MLGKSLHEVNPAHLAWGTCDHEKDDCVSEGDISASYSGECIAMGQQVRKLFRMDGEMWITLGLSDPSPTELPKIERLDERLSARIERRWLPLALYVEQSKHQVAYR